MKGIDVTSQDVTKILEIATENGLDFECFEGVLQDSFIVYNDGVININKKSSKFFIIKDVFVNSWSSKLVLSMTDSYEEVEKFREIFEN